MRALFLNGTVGSGKTSIADAVGTLLAKHGMPHGVIDVDWLSRYWPASGEDPFNGRLALANLASLARVYEAEGAGALVIAGVIENEQSLAAYRAATGADMWLARLTASPGELERRLRLRHANAPHELAWHLARAPELDAILAEAPLDQVSIDTTDRSIPEVAAQIVGYFIG